jgi:hypothetical protein
MTIRTWLDSLDEPKTTARDVTTQEAPSSDVRITLREFDPLTQVSADARYIVRNLVIWFLVVPIVLGLIIWGITR